MEENLRHTECHTSPELQWIRDPKWCKISSINGTDAVCTFGLVELLRLEYVGSVDGWGVSHAGVDPLSSHPRPCTHAIPSPLIPKMTGLLLRNLV